MASVLERLTAAQNAHDVDQFLSCFADEYRSDSAAGYRPRGDGS